MTSATKEYFREWLTCSPKIVQQVFTEQPQLFDEFCTQMEYCVADVVTQLATQMALPHMTQEQQNAYYDGEEDQ